MVENGSSTKLKNNKEPSSAGLENEISSNESRTGSVKKGYSSLKQIAVIGDTDTIIGFGLTGVKYLTTISKNTDNKEILNLIVKYIDSQELGFVIITQAIAERVRADFERLKNEKPLYPIFIELPDKNGELPDREDPIKDLIRRAIGMEIVKQ